MQCAGVPTIVCVRFSKIHSRGIFQPFTSWGDCTADTVCITKYSNSFVVLASHGLWGSLGRSGHDPSLAHPQYSERSLTSDYRKLRKRLQSCQRQDEMAFGDSAESSWVALLFSNLATALKQFLVWSISRQRAAIPMAVHLHCNLRHG
jgi:hypothetical protein